MGHSGPRSAGRALLALAAAGCALRLLSASGGVASFVPSPRTAAEAPQRRALLLGGVAAGTAAAAQDALAIEVDIPDRIKEDPFDLVGVNPDSRKEDEKEFYIKKSYREDTYQLLKHMKISGSLDKGTPRMERWQKRIKEEMDDWLALYRRQEMSVGRQSYYTLYSAINTMASHIVSYGPKFPFPKKRQQRYYELLTKAERYLEKGK
mmetsp:Transcript_53997/g.140657  ORF Transcript_53997/g.140657 Transcript_53997/m.140657 type:complete len:207 (-) Transcript_53997:339-959(-)